MAKIYFGEVNIINKKIVVPVYLDTEGESVNAYDLKIMFSNNLIFRDFQEAGSIINYWIEKPNLIQIEADNNVRNSSQESLQGSATENNVSLGSSPEATQPSAWLSPIASAGTSLGRQVNKELRTGSQEFATSYNVLQFSGVSIGGYVGKKGFLINLIFDAKGDKALVEILPSSKVLLNDGLGTEARLKTEKKIFKISELKTPEALVDNYPPESFRIYIYKDKKIFNGKYFITFQTTDKQTGIAYYEVAEKQSLSKPNIKDLNFEKADSPYLLKDQTLRSYIFVKAVDKSGNERIEYLKPQKLLAFDEILNILIFVIIIFFLTKSIKNKKLKIK
ncbi:MAG: hypothetical protein QXG91_04825 [Candidatus Aenigmatarchaeota archaeon]